MEEIQLALDFSEGLPLDVLALRDVAHDFAAQKLRAAGLAADRGGEAPLGVVREAGEIGLCAPNVPDGFGGPGVSALAHAAMMEELGWGNLGAALAIGTQALCAEAVLRAGDGEQQTRLLPGLCGAEDFQLGALALTLSQPAEGVRWSVAGGGYLLEGTAAFVANGGAADLTLVRASAAEGQALFAVRRSPGLTDLRRIETAGVRALLLSELSFSACSVQEDARLGGADAAKTAAGVLGLARVLCAAALIGTARAAYEEAAQYARSRVTFRRPIVEHEQVGGMLAQMRLRIQAARLMVYRAAGEIDAGRDAQLAAAEAAYLAGETALGATHDAVQAFGGYGFTQEFPVEMWMRDAAGARIAYGSGDDELREVARAIASGV